MEGQRRILDLCVDAGETLLANGAEIYRVQQTMEIIARSYGARSFHVYVLTNGLFASMEDGGAVQSAAVRSTPRVEMNLGRISAVNALSREIVAGARAAGGSLCAACTDPRHTWAAGLADGVGLGLFRRALLLSVRRLGRGRIHGAGARLCRGGCSPARWRARARR